MYLRLSVRSHKATKRQSFNQAPTMLLIMQIFGLWDFERVCQTVYCIEFVAIVLNIKLKLKLIFDNSLLNVTSKRIFCYYVLFHLRKENVKNDILK